MSGMDLSSFYNQFREEANENVRILNDGLLALEQMPDQRNPDAQAQVHAIFRAMHTIKGSARLLGFELVGKLAHTMENLLGTVREGQRSIDRPLADNLLRWGGALEGEDAEPFAAAHGYLERRRAGVSAGDLRHQTPWQEIYRTFVGQLATGACLEPATMYLRVIEERGNPRHSH